MDRCAKILSVGPTPPPLNGMSVATAYLLRSRVAEDFDVTHLDTADRRGLSNVGRLDGRNVVVALEHGRRFMTLLARSRPDIVYVPIAQNALGFLRDCLFMVPALWSGASLVVHIHGGHFGRFYATSSPLMRWVIRSTVGRAAATIVLGETLRPMLDGVASPERVFVVPNGIDDFVRGEGLQEVPADGHTVLYLSTVMEEKGALDLLLAAGSVVREIPDAKFIFAGEWFSRDEEVEALALIEDLGLADAASFLGVVVPPEKWEVLRGAGCFCLPSRYRFEGQPYSILEAMCAGLPVISTPVGAIDETVLDEVTGVLVEPGEVPALAEAILAMMRDEESRVSYGAAGRQRFLDYFTFRRWSDDMLEVFHVVQQTNGRGDGP